MHKPINKKKNITHQLPFTGHNLNQPSRTLPLPSIQPHSSFVWVQRHRDPAGNGIAANLRRKVTLWLSTLLEAMGCMWWDTPAGSSRHDLLNIIVDFNMTSSYDAIVADFPKQVTVKGIQSMQVVLVQHNLISTIRWSNQTHRCK